jgi:hypothetical protein
MKDENHEVSDDVISKCVDECVEFLELMETPHLGLVILCYIMKRPINMNGNTKNIIPMIGIFELNRIIGSHMKFGGSNFPVVKTIKLIVDRFTSGSNPRPINDGIKSKVRDIKEIVRMGYDNRYKNAILTEIDVIKEHIGDINIKMKYVAVLDRESMI